MIYREKKGHIFALMISLIIALSVFICPVHAAELYEPNAVSTDTAIDNPGEPVEDIADENPDDMGNSTENNDGTVSDNDSTGENVQVLSDEESSQVTYDADSEVSSEKQADSESGLSDSKDPETILSDTKEPEANINEEPEVTTVTTSEEEQEQQQEETPPSICTPIKGWYICYCIQD